MRFIFGFIFFGLLFYVIWAYFPDAFQVLVSWAAMVVDFVKGLFSKISGAASSSSHTNTP